MQLRLHLESNVSLNLQTDLSCDTPIYSSYGRFPASTVETPTKIQSLNRDIKIERDRNKVFS